MPHSLCFILAQSAPNASTIFYWSLLLIFLTAIVTTIVTKWSRDKCLKRLHGYHVTLENNRGMVDWGRLKTLSSGIELTYDHPYIDTKGRKKTSYMLYQPEVEQQVLTIFRYHDELDEEGRSRRLQQVQTTFNPNLPRRFWRGVRNFVNTLRDAFNAAISAVVGQYQRMNPAASVLASSSGSVTQIGQTLLGKFANAYEPLLEQYIGQPVIVEVADPLNPNNKTIEYSGYLADYSQQFLAIFNVDHTTDRWIEFVLPDVQHGKPMAPLPPPPPLGAPPPVLPEPDQYENDVALRIDGPRFKLQNTCKNPMVVRRLERSGFEPLEIGVVLPPNGILSLPARDAHGGKLCIEIIHLLDVVAPRKYAVVRHAGELVERPGLANVLGLDQRPLNMKKIFQGQATAREEQDPRQ